MIGASATPPRRRRIVPEVVQTSAMDCGPAALKAFLDGHGVPVSYGRLREACQTDIDGTSINTLEKLSNALGVAADQIMLPVDHVLLPEAAALPAIAVVRLPNGNTHFAVIWSRHGKFCQVMDPATGRSWRAVNRVTTELYRHAMNVPAQAWREWTSSPEFKKTLQRRMRDSGIETSTTESLLKDAFADHTWRSIAALDAAVRLVASLREAGGLRRSKAVADVVSQFIRNPAAIPEQFWSVLPVPDVPDQVRFHGAVVVRTRVASSTPTESTAQPAFSPELLATVREKSAESTLTVVRMLHDDGFLNLMLIIAVALLQAVGLIVQAVLLRGTFGVASHLVSRMERLQGLGSVVIFAAALFLLGLPSVMASLRYGRQIENRLRILLFEKLPRLGDPYFKSRLTGDMAERAHAVNSLRFLPALASQIVAGVAELLLTSACIIWLDPSLAPLAVCACIASIGVPLALQPLLSERELRVRVHVGALSRLNLDAMLGIIAIRAHTAERAFRVQQEELLSEWVRSALRFLRLSVMLDGAQIVVGTAFSAAILLQHLRHGGDVATSLLLVYWALNLPVIASALSQAARQYPTYRNIALRLLEPLSAPAATVRPSAPNASAISQTGAAIEFGNISVVVAGHTVLRDISLSIGPSEHVAIVGKSGAGKSSLVGLLLGWFEPATGEVRVDGKVFDAVALHTLRSRTAWVDPAIQLWNRSIAENLLYGTRDAAASLGMVIEQADLLSLLETASDGLQTIIGEGGGLLSGGEGQRVRLGRALARGNARLVILDEPFRGLDSAKRAALLKRARHFWRNATLLCITHDIGETLSFERVLVLDGGRVVEDNAPQTLRKSRDSKYVALLDHERHVRASIWGNPLWRRLSVDRATLVEHG